MQWKFFHGSIALDSFLYLNTTTGRSLYVSVPSIIVQESWYWQQSDAHWVKKRVKQKNLASLNCCMRKPKVNRGQVRLYVFGLLFLFLYVDQTPLWGVSEFKYRISLRVWRTGASTRRMNSLGTVRVWHKRLHEVDIGPLAPPSHLLLFKSVKKQNLRQGGGDICRGIHREAVRKRVEHRCPLPYRPPSGGGTITTIS